MNFNKKEKFSIRKFHKGAASVLIGASLLAFGGQTVWAEETAEAPAIQQENPAGEAQEETPQAEVVEIASPVTAIADETKEVGYHEVVAQGQAGQLIISETDGVKTLERVEPTETVEVYGTKPTVVEEIHQKATTEYVANPELEAKTTRVKQEGVDGKTVTTTSYRVQSMETIKSELLGLSTNSVFGRYETNYENHYGYSIDDSFALPSDKIILDEESLKQTLIGLESGQDWSDVLKQVSYSLQAGEYRDYVGFSDGPPWDLDGSVKAYLLRNTSNPDRYADVKADYFRFQEVLNHLYDNYQGQELIDFIKTYLSQETQVYDIGHSYTSYGLRKSGDSYDSPLIHEFKLDSGSSPNITTYYRRYLAELDQAGIEYEVVSPTELRVDGEIYQITSGSRSFEPTKLATEWTDEEVLAKFKDWIDGLQTSFETQTKRYNNNLGFADSINLVYETTAMPEEEQVWFKQQLDKLPSAIKKALVKVTVTDDSLDGRRGLAFSDNYQILLEYPAMGSKEELLRVFMHELSHIIDFNAVNGHSNLTYSMEFTGLELVGDSLYSKYYNRPITEEQVPIRPYNQDYAKESFAEFFGYYLLNRIYGYDHVKYINIDGEVLTLRTADWGNTPEEIIDNRENALKYYDDPRAYSPVEETKWFYDQLYTALFEQPTQAEVVIDQITTEVIDVQQKIVEVGTKPQVVEQITTYTTIEQEDAELLIGERKVIQIGKDGIVMETTSYELVDKTTGEVKATTTSQLVQEMVEEIIAVGTRKAPVVTMIYRQTATGVEQVEVTDDNGQVTEKVLASYTDSSSETLLPFETLRQTDASLDLGQERVIQAGLAGKEISGLTYTVVDGQLVKTPTLERIAPIEEIIAVGSKVTPVEEVPQVPSQDQPGVDNPQPSSDSIQPSSTTPATSDERPADDSATPGGQEAGADASPTEPSRDDASAPAEEVPQAPNQDQPAVDNPLPIADPSQPSTTTPATGEHSSSETGSTPSVASPTEVSQPTTTSPTREPATPALVATSPSSPSGTEQSTAPSQASLATASGQGTLTPKPVGTAASSTPAATYSRVARAQAEKTLPNTGESTSVLTLVGLGMVGLGVLGRKRRQG